MKGLLHLSSVRIVLILDMCIFRGPAVLQKALDHFVSIKKEQRAAEHNFLARLQRSFTCPTTISGVRTFFGGTASTSDQGQNSEEHDLACLGSSPIVQNGSSLQGNKQHVSASF